MRLPFSVRDQPTQRNFDFILKYLRRCEGGRVDSAGVVLSGTGFSVSHPGTGDYTVTFSPSYGSAPGVVATPEGAGAVAAKIGAITASSFQVTIFTTTTGVNLDLGFSFVVISPP